MLVPNKGKLHPPYYQLHYLFCTKHPHCNRLRPTPKDDCPFVSLLSNLLAPILSNIPPTNF